MLSKKFLRAGALVATLSIFTLSAHAETLTSALASAYTNNPAITSALLSVKSSAETIAMQKAGKLPTIGFSASATDNFTIGAPGGDNNSLGVTGGFSYSQTLFDNFRTDANIEQARALSELAVYAMQNQEQNVLLAVVEAYMNVVRDTQLVQLRADNVTFLQAQVKSAQDRLDIGEGTKLDVSQAQTRLAIGVASYKSAIASLQTSQASYERWVGHKPKNLTQDYRFGTMLPRSIEDALALSEAHPAILSAKASIRAAQSASDAARAGFGPTFNLIGNLCTFGCFNGDLSTPGFAGSVKLSLSIPIYAGGQIGASVRKANLEQIKSEVDAMATRDQVKEAVVSAWSTLQNATAQIESAQQTLESASLVLDATIQSRDVGQSTTLDVLDAQATVTSAREALVQASTGRVIASFALVAATGQLSASKLGLPVQIKSAEGYTSTVEDVWMELRSLAVE